MRKKLNILLCNDDGYNSEGIQLLYKKLRKYGNVYICAPSTHMSGKSCSISIGKKLKLTKHSDDIYSVEGTPADACALGLNALNVKFDLVVSGCNNGLNISYDTIYSGTIGVCLEALRYHTPAIAFSCDGNFDLVDKYFDKVMKFLLKQEMSIEYLYNVNFPLGNKVKDIRFGSLYYRNDKPILTHNKNFYLFEREIDKNIPIGDNDCYHVNNGIVSIVKLNKTYYK